MAHQRDLAAAVQLADASERARHLKGHRIQVPARRVGQVAGVEPAARGHGGEVHPAGRNSGLPEVEMGGWPGGGPSRCQQRGPVRRGAEGRADQQDRCRASKTGQRGLDLGNRIGILRVEMMW